jgi:signal transduction histidine kinase
MHPSSARGTEAASPPLPDQDAVIGASRLAAEAAVWSHFLSLRVISLQMVLRLGVLTAAGHPSWRIVAVALTDAVLLPAQVLLMKRATRRSFSERDLRLITLLIVLDTCLVAALTGGLGSPFAWLLMGIAAAAPLAPGGGQGWYRQAAALLITSFVLLALLPADWAGPLVRQPFRTFLTLAPFSAILMHSITKAKALDGLLADADARLTRLRQSALEDARRSAQRLETLGAKVAHELKNPLAAVKGLVQLVALNPGDARTPLRTERAAQEVERIEGILREYLSFARALEEVRAEQVKLGELVDYVLTVMEARALTRGVTLARVGGEASVQGDPRRLKEALLNLLTNAVEATPRQGTVTVSLQALADGGAELIIRDTGEGIPPERLARIGTAVGTTRPDGTGLGALLARGVVLQHGGELRYESEVGRGTTVFIRLPGGEGPAPKGEAHGPHPAH